MLFQSGGDIAYVVFSKSTPGSVFGWISGSVFGGSPRLRFFEIDVAEVGLSPIWTLNSNVSGTLDQSMGSGAPSVGHSLVSPQNLSRILPWSGCRLTVLPSETADSECILPFLRAIASLVCPVPACNASSQF